MLGRWIDYIIRQSQTMPTIYAQPCLPVRKLDTMYWFGFSVRVRESQLEVRNISVKSKFCYKVTTELI